MVYDQLLVVEEMLVNIVVVGMKVKVFNNCMFGELLMIYVVGKFLEWGFIDGFDLMLFGFVVIWQFFLLKEVFVIFDGI